ncbi:MAG TPA: SDR family NAD(P)-dependent oxidoreductase [Acidimicrobiales bacterium]|jgi:short-subunit dehydrogenase|nr:SDR family NAD(P)-dependent oxidoreductase [Acidimicrobiales bacterium]
MTFVESYGPWAVIAGASEGVGAVFAAAVAKEGVNVVLLARRQGALDEVAASIRDESGVETRTVAVDLAAPTAMQTVADATRDVDVGLLMYCAGADPNYRPFLDNPVEVATAMVRRNCTVPVQMCHHFAGPMAERGRGGIIVLSSGGGFVGAPNMVIYGGSKAFDIVFTEALWAELHPRGVDVLSLVLGETDTPALRRLRAERGFADDADAPLPGVATVDEVVKDALEHLAHGPSWMVGEQLRAGLQMLGGMPRNDAVDIMMKAASATMDQGDGTS